MDIKEEEFLHDYNKVTYKRVVEILKTEDSCAVVQPTGTGKSYIMMKLLYDYRDKWKIVIAPSRDFLDSLEQNKYWTSEKTLTLTYACIGRNYKEIERTLADYKINKTNVSLIVLDELHRAGAPKWGEGIRNLMTLCTNAKTVGLTATPKRYDEGRDMVEEIFGGNIACNMNLGEAVKLGIIPQLYYVVGMHSLTENLDEVVKNIPSDSCEQYIKRAIISYKEKWSFDNYFCELIKKYINTNETSGKHIVFTSSIDEAIKTMNIVKRWFINLFPNSNVKVFCIHSKSLSKSIDTEMFFADNKENEVKVAIAVNMLNESFHCNDIKTISMFRGTQSIQVYMQQIGRALTAHGNSPYIFDFVDNFHSIKQIQDMLNIGELKEIDNNIDNTNLVFKEFNDETKWLAKDIMELNQLTGIDSIDTIRRIVDRLSESDDDTIFGVEDIDFVDWANYMLKAISGTQLNISTNEEINKLYEKLKLSIDIANYLGKEWYYTFRQYLVDKESISEYNMKSFKSTFNKAIILNSLSVETREFFAGKGLISKITSNEERLTAMINKYKPKILRIGSKICNYKQVMSRDNHFEQYKLNSSISKALVDSVDRTWSFSMIGDACCYWLWEIYKNTYKEQIEQLNIEFQSLGDLDDFLRNSKKSVMKLDIAKINNVDKIIDGHKSLDEFDERQREMFVYYEVKTMEYMYRSMYRYLGFETFEKNIDYKIEYIITMDNCTEDIKNYIKSYDRLVDKALCLNYYTWSDKVMEKANQIKNTIKSVLAFVNGEDAQEDTAWFWDFTRKKKEEYVFLKSKKYITIDNSHSNNKLNRFYDKLNSIDAIIENMTDKYAEQFTIEFNKAKKEWIDTYGSYEIDDLSFIIGLIAMSRMGKELASEKISVINLKTVNSIVIFFDWLVTSEKCDVINTPERIRALNKACKLMKSDLAYLMILAMSKTNRYNYLSMYTFYINTGRIIQSTCVDIITKMSDRDNQLMYNAYKSCNIQEFTKVKELNDIIMHT